MKDLIEILQSIAWPVASIVIALTILVIVFRVTSKRGEFSLGIKDWVKIGTKSGSEELEKAVALESQPLPPNLIENTAETVAEVTPEQGDDASEVSFWNAKTSIEIEEAFNAFKREGAYQSDAEFWETIKISRLVEIGAVDESEDLERLSQTNQTWVWPLIFLMRRHVRLQEENEAEAALRAALARDNPTAKRWVLREGVTSYFRFSGTQRALEFIAAELPKANDLEIGTMFSALADLNESKNDIFSSAVLSEIGLGFDKFNKSATFNLAYKYGGSDRLKLLAFNRYTILEHESEWQSAANNMGVAAPNDNPSLKRSFYEEALSNGSEIAAANLARELVSSGFIRRAEEVISKVPQDYNGSAIEAVADARLQIAKAKETLSKDKQTFQEFARQEGDRYTAAVRETFRRFRSSGALQPTGIFATDDGTLHIQTDAEGAFCKWEVGQSEFTGRIEAKPFCYNGTLTSGTGLLAPTREMVVFWVEEEQLRIFVPPDASTIRDGFKILHAKKLPEPPRELLESAIAHPGLQEGAVAENESPSLESNQEGQKPERE